MGDLDGMEFFSQPSEGPLAEILMVSNGQLVAQGFGPPPNTFLQDMLLTNFQSRDEGFFIKTRPFFKSTPGGGGD